MYVCMYVCIYIYVSIIPSCRIGAGVIVSCAACWLSLCLGAVVGRNTQQRGSDRTERNNDEEEDDDEDDDDDCLRCDHGARSHGKAAGCRRRDPGRKRGAWKPNLLLVRHEDVS